MYYAGVSMYYTGSGQRYAEAAKPHAARTATDVPTTMSSSITK